MPGLLPGRLVASCAELASRASDRLGSREALAHEFGDGDA